jgi:hypothetical protein
MVDTLRTGTGSREKGETTCNRFTNSWELPWENNGRTGWEEYEGTKNFPGRGNGTLGELGLKGGRLWEAEIRPEAEQALSIKHWGTRSCFLRLTGEGCIQI